MSKLIDALRIWFKLNQWGLLIIAGTWLAFFSRTIFAQQVYFLDDLKIIFYPLEYAFAQAEQHWQLPVWSPLFGFGQPLIGWGQLGFFTPLHFILRLFHLHPLLLIQISILTYFALGSLGMFIFLRRKKLLPLAAALGAILFTFSGFHIGHLSHVNFYTSTMILPWLLLVTDYFIDHPNRRSAALLAILLAIIPLSGQPQISLYAFIIATLYGGITLCTRFIWPLHLKAILIRLGWLIPVALIAYGLASFSIIPLQKFLVQTERSDALTKEELLDFSYPPSYAITLIAPYFFGDHDYYWGAKGLQELSAYVGVMPLLLSGYAFWNWKKYRSLQGWATLLIIISITFAIGRYSPVYRYGVDKHWFDAFAEPGRFVFFFDVGVAILAALGLEALIKKTSRLAIISTLLVPLCILIPFILKLNYDHILAVRLLFLLSHYDYQIILIILGIILWLSFLIPSPHFKNRSFIGAIVVLQSITLVMYGWSFTPLTSWKEAVKDSPFTEELQRYSQQIGLPPRLFSYEELLQKLPKQVEQVTKPIGPDFSVYQPLENRTTNDSCLTIPMQSNQAGASYVYIGLHQDLLTPALEQKVIFANNLSKIFTQKICFSTLKKDPSSHFILSFTSPEQTSIRLLYKALPLETKSAYFLNSPSLTADTIARSSKNARLIFDTTIHEKIDNESALLMRHLQVIAGSSSARWIGALSIKSYREFIEQFFANDRDPYSGDDQHVLVRYRSLFNMVGINYFTQIITKGAEDLMPQHGFILVKSVPVSADQDIRLYYNPQAFPKVFMVRNGEFEPAADVTRDKMSSPDFDPKKSIYIDGSGPPDHFAAHSDAPLQATAKIMSYATTRVDVQVDSAEEAFLILNDSPTLSWHTYLDGQPQLRLIANTLFRAAQVPSGHHIVSFRYEPDSIATSKRITIIAVGVIIMMLVIPDMRRFLRHPTP